MSAECVDVDGIARHLPGIWSAAPNDVERGTGGAWVGLGVGPGQGLSVWCWGPDRGRLKLHVRPADRALSKFISGYTVRELKSGPAEITVSAGRPAAEIAGEIVRRLLPGGRELLELASQAHQVECISNATRDRLVAELLAACPGLERRREESGSVILAGVGDLYLEVSGYRTATDKVVGAVDFRHFRPDGPLAVAVVRAVGEYLAGKAERAAEVERMGCRS